MKPARWVRHTQFSGSHYFCNEHAKLETDFNALDSYKFWEELPPSVSKPEPEHTYPSNYPPGCHWAITEGWKILDSLKPGVLDESTRAFLCGQIAGALMRVKGE
jgi:hypothetical protein